MVDQNITSRLIAVEEQKSVFEDRVRLLETRDIPTGINSALHLLATAQAVGPAVVDIPSAPVTEVAQAKPEQLEIDRLREQVDLLLNADSCVGKSSGRKKNDSRYRRSRSRRRDFETDGTLSSYSTSTQEESNEDPPADRKKSDRLLCPAVTGLT